MIEGKCPKCGQQYFGWALLQPRNQSCAKCGTGLLITEDSGKSVTGYSPFTAKEYKLESNLKTEPAPEKDVAQ
jgi:DNA-directed RNA polymerase subunit M/transcription elongation factor TFIIS